MLDENFRKAIKIIQRRLDNNNIKWALIGSANMQLQGMNVFPQDLDIIVQLKDLEKMRGIFLDYNSSKVNNLKPMTSEPGWEVKIEIEGVEVQILGERDTGEYVSKLLENRLIHVKLDEIGIPCFTLEAEAQTYSETNREHKSDLIKQFLNKRKIN